MTPIVTVMSRECRPFAADIIRADLNGREPIGSPQLLPESEPVWVGGELLPFRDTLDVWVTNCADVAEQH